MPLTLITGRANSGKTGLVLEHVRAARGRGAAASVVMPSETDVRRFRRWLPAQVAGGIEVVQFDRWAASSWQLLGDGRRMVTAAQRMALVRHACAREGLDAIGPIAGCRGVHALVCELAMWAAWTGPPESRGLRSEVARDLVGAVRAYRKILATAGLVEPGEAYRSMAETGPLAPGRTVAAHDFVDLDPSQMGLLIGAHEGGADVVVSLPYAEDAPGTWATRPLVEALEDAGARRVVADESPRSVTPELAALERSLFRAEDPIEPRGSVVFAAADGEDGEALQIAAEVRRLVDSGEPPERVAVVFRDGARHRGWLRAACVEAGIEADFDVRVPVRETAMGRAVSHLWSFVTAGMSRHDLAAFLRTPFSGAEPDAVDDLEARWRRSATTSGRALLKGLAACGRPVERLVTDGLSLSGRGLDRSSAACLSAIADTMLSNAWPGDAPVLDEGGLVDTAVHRAITDAVRELLCLGELVTCGDVLEVVAGSSVSPRVAEREGRVQVIDAGRARARRFDVVVLGGMSAGEFPASGGRDLWAGPGVAEAAGAMGLVRDPDAPAARERLMLYQVVTRPRDKLVLTRHASSAGGDAAPPSVFWHEVRDLYRDPSDEEWEPPPGLDMEEIGVRGPTRPGSRRTAVLRDEANLAALSVRTEFSASELESYVRCPYRWFQDRAVGAEALDRSFDPLAAGGLAHKALERFYASLEGRTGSRRVTPDMLPEALDWARSLAEEAAAEQVQATDLGEREAVRGTIERVVALVERDAGFLVGYEPAYLEWRFGADGDPPVSFDGFGLKGRIDRIDTGPAGLVVIDYKLGKAQPAASFADWGVLQLPLYALAARERLDLPVAGGLYRSLKQCDDRGFVLDGVFAGAKGRDVFEANGIEQVCADAVARATAAVEGIRAGEIAPVPSTRWCRACSHVAVCPAVAR